MSAGAQTKIACLPTSAGAIGGCSLRRLLNRLSRSHSARVLAEAVVGLSRRLQLRLSGWSETADEATVACGPCCGWFCATVGGAAGWGARGPGHSWPARRRGCQTLPQFFRIELRMTRGRDAIFIGSKLVFGRREGFCRSGGKARKVTFLSCIEFMGTTTTRCHPRVFSISGKFHESDARAPDAR